MTFDSTASAGETRYRQLFEHAPIGIINVSLDGRPLMVNQRAASTFGYDSRGNRVWVATADPAAADGSSTTTVTISADVLFEFDEATLTDNAQETLADQAEQLSGLTGTVEVVGHSDGIGDDDYNQRLSEDRAEAVKEALEEELGERTKLTQTMRFETTEERDTTIAYDGNDRVRNVGENVTS